MKCHVSLLISHISINISYNSLQIADAEYDGNIDDQTTAPPVGYVQMLVTPSKTVEVNTSVVVTVTSDGTFPEPR